MIWSLGNPNFCFPSNIWSKLAEGITTEGVTNKLKACLIRLSTPLTYEKISAY
jgi:hypothetical protein